MSDSDSYINKQGNINKLVEEMFKFKPHEIMHILFAYLGTYLVKMPRDKRKEFFILFKDGVLEARAGMIAVTINNEKSKDIKEIK